MELDILVTLNANYLRPLKVMLKSFFLNNPGVSVCVYLMHAGIPLQDVDATARFVEREGHCLREIRVAEDWFSNAPASFYYTKEMYFRLLAFQLLPTHLDRILYLDPDILVLNSAEQLYGMDLGDHLFAAAYHDKPAVRQVNQLRLGQYSIDAYYNSGVLLMNLAQQRRDISDQAIFSFVEQNHAKLIMPDQDVLNALFGRRILTLDEKLYNYDARFFNLYWMQSGGQWTMEQLIHHTVFLHFCGKRKPWSPKYSGKFDALYRHYEKLALG